MSSVHHPATTITSEATISIAPLQTAIPGNKNISCYLQLQDTILRFNCFFLGICEIASKEKFITNGQSKST
jgi:hypothetical protein